MKQTTVGGGSQVLTVGWEGGGWSDSWGSGLELETWWISSLAVFVEWSHTKVFTDLHLCIYTWVSLYTRVLYSEHADMTALQCQIFLVLQKPQHFLETRLTLEPGRKYTR
jgi:hypothetical protein